MRINQQNLKPKIFSGGSAIQNKKNFLKSQKILLKQTICCYSLNSDKINQVLKQEIGETFATYYDELKNLDDSWKPISLQGEKSKTLLFLPFLPKWKIQNDQRVFTGIWDIRNKQEYSLNEKFVQKIWPQIQLLDQRIIGTILGNGSVAKRGHIILNLKNAQHVYWKYIFLKPFCNLAPLLLKRENKQTGKIYYVYQFFTWTVFQDYRELFYPDGKKIVPSCVPDLLQAPEGLAEIYMDVGNFDKVNGNYHIYSYSFQKKEQEFLQEKLFNFHGLESSLHKDGHDFRIYLLKKNSPILIQKLKDHMLPMFYNQLGSVLDTGLKRFQIDEQFNRQDLRELQKKISIGDEQ